MYALGPLKREQNSLICIQFTNCSSSEISTKYVKGHAARTTQRMEHRLKSPSFGIDFCTVKENLQNAKSKDKIDIIHQGLNNAINHSKLISVVRGNI